MHRSAKSLPAGLVLFLWWSSAMAAATAISSEATSRLLDEIRCQEYQFSALEDGIFSAPNRAQDLRSTFSDAGLQILPRTRSGEPWSVALRLARIGREKRMSDVAPVAPEMDGQRVVYRRPGIVEWYVNAPDGLEQGFDLAGRPAGAACDGRVVLEMTVASALTAAAEPEREAVVFTTAGGEAALRYSELVARDARGRELDAVLALERGSLRILVDDRDAVYPVAIDPLVNSPSWTTSGTTAFDSLGYSVASAGDVNGDTHPDLIVGVPGYDNGEVDEGRVFLFLGSFSGPIGTSWVAEGNQAGAQFGYSVASAGDVNGDGKGDVVVGAPLYDNGQVDEGRVYVYHGQAAPPGLPSVANRILERDQGGAQLGFAVASAGRINSSDTYGDIIASAPFYDNGQLDEGRVWVWKGSATGIPNDAHWRAEINQANAMFGLAVSSAGDVNADGDDEVLIGAPSYDSGQFDEGAAFLWEGGNTGLGNNGTPSNVDWSAQSDQVQAFFGVSVAPAGNVNGDAYDDIIVGADLYDNGQLDEGSAFLWHGNASFASGPDGTPSNASWRAESDQAHGPVGPPEFGFSVASAGDVNGDGFGDIVVGAYFYSLNGTTNPGSVFLWQGSSTGLGANGTPSNVKDRLDGESDGAGFGYSVAGVGDVQSDTFDDVLVGAPFQDTTVTDGGRAYLFNGEENRCRVLCQVTWCKFQDFECTADCQETCCDYVDCHDAPLGCNAEPCPPNACPGACN